MLKGKGLLIPIQTTFLEIFAQVPDQERFFLTGGTALAEYYLGHRLSFRSRFFTGEAGPITPVSYQIETFCSSKGLQLFVLSDPKRIDPAVVRFSGSEGSWF